MAGVWFRVMPPEPVQNKPFSGNPGPKNMPPRNASPLQYFLLFFNLNLIREVVQQTNRPDSKIRPMIDHFNRVATYFYTPDRNICVDESLIGRRGRTAMLQYIPSKAAKFGVKFWVLSESTTGYVAHLKCYLAQKLNREKFKEFVNTLAGIKTDERGEKILVLKKKFKPGHNNADSFSQLEAARDSRVQDESRVRAQTESSSTHGADQSAEMNSNHLSNASSISSVASTNSGPATSEDDVNASVVSVRERAHHLNRMESESELQKMTEAQSVKSQRSTKDRDGDPDEDSQSSGSCFNLDSEEKEWIVASSSSEYHPMHKMLTKNPNLVNIKDFTSGYTALHWAAKHGKPEVIKLLASQRNVDINKRTNGGYTALHLAAMHGHEEIIELLVSTYKADANLRDYSGKKAKQYLRNTASTKAQQLLLSRKLGSSMGSGRSLDDSFTRSASFRRSKQVKAISNLIHGSSSGVKAMFRTTWTGSADELGRNRMSRSRSPSATPPTSGHSSPSPQRRETFASRSVDRELMPPPSGPARKRREAQSTSEGNPTPEEIPRTISEPSLVKGRGSKTFI